MYSIVCLTVHDDVRLVGGIGHCVGMLEMKHERQWRPADHQSWDQRSASVLCRQLECGTAISTQRTSDSTLGPVWVMRSSCDGSESSLRWCGRRNIDQNVKYVTSTKRLEVICSGNKHRSLSRPK